MNIITVSGKKDEYNIDNVELGQIYIDREKFSVNPDNGSYKLRADGCFKRHDIDRIKQLQTEKEDITRDFTYDNKEERLERRFMNKLSMYISQGMKPLATESIEDFVARCEGDFEVI